MAKLDMAWVVTGGPRQQKVFDDLRAMPQGKVSSRIAELGESARRGGPDERNLYAVVLAQEGRVGDALAEWESLIARYPDFVDGWLNAASAHFAEGRVEKAIATLENCPTPRDTAHGHLVRPRLDALRERHRSTVRNREMLELRVAALRERIAHGVDEPGDARLLAVALAVLWPAKGSGVTPDEIATAARRAWDRDRNDVAVLEVLVHALDAAGDRVALAEAVHELEQRAPHSATLHSLRPPKLTKAAEAGLVAEHHRTVGVQIEKALRGDSTALTRLREMNRMLPRDRGVKAVLMMAALQEGMKSGDLSEAVAMADALVAEAPDSHDVHFHAGQIHWHNRDEKKAVHHLRRAYDLADNDDDRALVFQTLMFLNEKHDYFDNGKGRWR
ncbi:tetratricopeptide repeat protein [Streptomyces sp. NPDC058914]|uniref:tetratricopeptide repeat protein n=1 Tax=Streptomyces TaxID=1883 RepID=UPI00369C13C9